MIMTEYRLNAYHVMWLFVFFDLPVSTKDERKAAAIFRNSLENDGFVMKQYSVYVRVCSSKENKDVHVRRVKSLLPASGKVSILSVTDKQYGEIYNFLGAPRTMEKKQKRKKGPNGPIQLELF